MFRRSKRTKRTLKTRGPRGKCLRFEPLERRELLTVDIFTNGAGAHPLFPDGAANNTLPAITADVDVLLQDNDGLSDEVSMRWLGGNTYEIRGLNGTQLIFNGTAVPDGPTGDVQNVTVTGNIYVDLDNIAAFPPGPDTFKFLPQSPTVDSETPANLFITADGGDTVEIGVFDPTTHELVDGAGVIVNGQLGIGGVFFSTSTVRIGNSTVKGTTVIRNPWGASETTLINDDFRGDTTLYPDAFARDPGGIYVNEGAGAPVAFAMTNQNEKDTTYIDGNTTFGAGIPVVPRGLSLVIDNSNSTGGSMLMVGTDDQYGGTVTVLGRMEIRNGANVAGRVDFIDCVGLHVTEATLFDNDGGVGGSNMTLTSCELGTDSLSGSGLLGYPVVVGGGNGPDSFSSTGLIAQWGLFITYIDALPAADTAGSYTSIIGGSIGTRIGGPSVGLLGAGWLPATITTPLGPGTGAGYTNGDALVIQGDQGAVGFNDTVLISGVQLGGPVRAELHDGTNDFTITRGAALAPISLVGLFYNSLQNAPGGVGLGDVEGNGVDTVTIDRIIFLSSFAPTVQVYLGDNDDIVYLKGDTDLTTAGLPNVRIHAGDGPGDQNELHKEAGVQPAIDNYLDGVGWTFP